jgi:hypothetical protein
MAWVSNPPSTTTAPPSRLTVSGGSRDAPRLTLTVRSDLFSVWITTLAAAWLTRNVGV